MLLYPALPSSCQTLDYTAGIIRRHRRQIGSCWRKLTPGRQALLVLAYLRKGETFAARVRRRHCRPRHSGAIEDLRKTIARTMPFIGRAQLTLPAQPGPPDRTAPGRKLTPVMARLDPTDVEVLDTLITAGIVPNRAEDVRWALNRIRERPAYTQLREHNSKIDELKAQL